jgi:enolase
MERHSVTAIIDKVALRKVYDSRGNPTVEADIFTKDGLAGRASCPSGASTGTHEVRSFPSGGVDEAIKNSAEKGVPRFQGFALGRQEEFDKLLKEVDGTEDFSFLGGNTATALSVAYASATAKVLRVPLWKAIGGGKYHSGTYPATVGNVLNGGVHAIGGPDIQEFIAFVKAPEVRLQVETAFAVHRAVGRRLKALFPSAALGRGDEGGWVAPLNNEQALNVLSESCKEVRDAMPHKGITIQPGLDLAASELFKDAKYHYKDKTLTPSEQVDYVARLIETYDLIYVEDPFDEEDYQSFSELTSSMKGRKDLLIVGDDIYTTSPSRVKKGIDMKASNSVLLKVNQVGTLSETLETVRLARKAGWSTVVSHRSGETPDSWLAHVAVAVGSRGLKCGVLGGERVAKLNELVRIAEGA